MKAVWNKLISKRWGKYTIWGSAAAIVIAVAVVIALNVGGNKPDIPSISETTPTGTTATTPEGDTGTTPGGNETTPQGGNTTPDGGNTPPDGGNTTPDGGNTKPDNGNTTPDGGNTKPDSGNTTPDSGNKVDPSTPFVPTMRFVVTSDIHTRTTENNYMSHDRLDQFYQTAYAYADAQTDYKKLDGMFFIGDITNNGELEEYAHFFNYVKAKTRTGTVAQAVIGNHEFYDTGNYTSASMTNAPIRFMEQSGDKSVDKHQVINGYHFITMGMDKYNKNSNLYFSTAKLAWLKKELDAAVAADPTKPIFLFQHEPPKDTVVGSYSVNGDKGLKTLLANYPQVIDFSGHSHRPLSNTRSIWQDSFTALNTGSLAYLSVAIPGHEKYSDGGICATDKEGSWGTEQDMRDGVMYYIVETDQHNRVRIQIYNMLTLSIWGEPYIIDSLNPKDFKYTDARKDAADKPVFAANATLTLQGVTSKTVTVALPQATSKDIVQSYRVELYQGSTLKETAYRLACTNYGDAAPKTIRATFSGLEASTAYTVKVYAVNSWAKESSPLVLNFTSKAVGDDIAADVLSVSFRQDGTAVNALTGEVLRTFGTPTVTQDATLGKYVATFDGKDNTYTYDGITGWYETISNSFSVEAYVYLDKKPSSGFMDFVANLNSAGFGLAYKNDGKIYFYCHVGGAYVTPSYSFAVGQWVHIVGTFDGTNVKLYVNGQLVATKAASGTMKAPTIASSCLGIGADMGKHNEARESYFQGKLATVNIYSAELSASQIAKLYQAYQK